MVLIGLRAANFPEEHEKLILVNYIKKHYSGHTAEEIKLAFEKAVAGELELDEVNCYENFSVMYFAKVMNAYRIWAAAEYQRTSIPNRKARTPTQQETEYLEIQRVREEIETYYQQILQINKTIPTEIPEYFKYRLIKDGLMNQDDDLQTFFRTRIEKEFSNIYVK